MEKRRVGRLRWGVVVVSYLYVEQLWVKMYFLFLGNIFLYFFRQQLLKLVCFSLVFGVQVYRFRNVLDRGGRCYKVVLKFSRIGDVGGFFWLVRVIQSRKFSGLFQVILLKRLLVSQFLWVIGYEIYGDNFLECS